MDPAHGSPPCSPCSRSHAIPRYLAAREGRDDLLPDDRRERAMVNEFLDRFHTGIRAEFLRHEAPALGHSPEAAVLGRFTIADRALAPVLHRTTRTGLDLAPHPRPAALRERLTARPSFLAGAAVG